MHTRCTSDARVFQLEADHNLHGATSDCDIVMAVAVAAVCTPEVCDVTSHRDIMARDVSSRSGLHTTQAAQKKSPNFTHRTEAASPMHKVWDFLWSPHFVRCVLPLVCLVVAISLSLSRFFSWSPFKSRPSFNQVLACSTFVIRACAQHVHDMAASIRTCAKLARPLHGRPQDADTCYPVCGGSVDTTLRGPLGAATAQRIAVTLPPPPSI